MNQQLLNTLVEALRFYADGENTRLLRNRHGIDFDTERKALVGKGFSFDSESYNGDEFYIEDGRTARVALDKLENYIEEENDRSRTN